VNIKRKNNMKIYIGILIMVALAACAGNNRPAKQAPAGDSMTAMTPEEVEYDTALVGNKRDPVCRMPIRAGIYDTAHYNGAVLGFCSSACKDSFLLHPGAYELVMK
jgi:YHS domain-containing protein